MDKPISRRRILLCFAILLLIVISDFLIPQTMVSHDTEFHVIRIRELAKSMERGEWFPSIFPDVYDGFGYAIPLFYTNFTVYLPAILTLLGVDLLVSYKILLILIAALTIALTWTCSLRMTGDRMTAALCTVFYVGSAYFAADLVERAAVGELFGFAFFPVVLLGIYRSCYGEIRFNFPLVLGFFLTAISHLLSLIMFSGLFAIFILLNIRRYLREPKRIVHIALAAVTVFLLAGAYFLPLIEQYANARFFTEYHLAIFNPATASVRLRNIFIKTGPSEYVYTPPVGLTMLAMIILWFFTGKRGDADLHRMRNSCLLGGLFCLYMSTAYFPYRALDPLFNVLQFPWRFYLPASLFLAFSGACALREIAGKRRWKESAVLAVCLVLCAAQFLSVSVPSYIDHRSDPMNTHANLAASDEYFVMMDENYLNANNTKSFWNNRTKVIYFEGRRVQAQGSSDYGVYTLTYTGAEGETVFEVPLVYYWGYTARDEQGRALPVSPGEHGLVAVTVSESAGTVTVRYEKTAIQKYSPVLSVLAAAAVAAILISERKRAKKNGNPA